VVTAPAVAAVGAAETVAAAETETEPAAETIAAAETVPAAVTGFRPDVEGLRGVAILLVLLFHGAFPIPGGFIGVDVFFVISGFLITGMLIREIGLTGTVALDRFYARRIRRLLPAAAVVLAVTLPLAYAVTAPLDRARAMGDGMASILSVSNIRFALADGDYFSAVSDPSPFLHF
jgi:peptidoglycan/LPS O-acetylase OafA/YrhL